MPLPTRLSKISQKQVTPARLSRGGVGTAVPGPDCAERGGSSCGVFQVWKQVAGAGAFSPEEGRTGFGVSLFLLLEVKGVLTSLSRVSVSLLQAVHLGMRALIYHTSAGGSQAEQSGMRTYYFSADTQEDMNAWVRAMNQAAQLLSRSSLKRSVPAEGPRESASCLRMGTQTRTPERPEFHH